jgi:hypothetical protein
MQGHSQIFQGKRGIGCQVIMDKRNIALINCFSNVGFANNAGSSSILQEI